MQVPLRIAGVAAAVMLALAPFTKPDQAAHERHVDSALASIQSTSLREGAWLKWLLIKGADLMRTGRYQEGTFSSSYQVLVAGREVAHCTGALGMVLCVRSKP